MNNFFEEDVPKVENKIKKDLNTPKINPSFRLQKVDILLTINSLINNQMNDITLPETITQKVKSTLKMDRIHGDNPDSEFYTYKPTNQRMVTTDHDLREIYVNNRNLHGLPITSDPCDYCRHIIDPNVRNSKPIGIPISMIRDQYGNLTFKTIDYYCNLSCAYAQLIRETKGRLTSVHPRYTDSETILKHLFSLLYPDLKLTDFRPAKNWRLYNGGRGPLSYVNYIKNNYYFYETSGICVIPSKMEYMEMYKNGTILRLPTYDG